MASGAAVHVIEKSRRGEQCGVLCSGVVKVSDLFRSRTPNLNVGGLIPHDITSANLDFHHCVKLVKSQFLLYNAYMVWEVKDPLGQ